MQEVVVKTYCDYPDCAESHKRDFVSDQKTTRTTILVYTNGKGRKPEPIEILLCDDHLAQMKTIFQLLQKHDMREN